jgi:phage FluMu protein Com
MKVKCDYCGSCNASVIELSDSTRVDCPECKKVDFIWKDNEYEWDDDGGDEKP